MDNLEQAKAARDKLLEQVGSGSDGPMNGAGICHVKGKLGIRGYLVKPADTALPQEIDGFPVDWVVVGEIRAL